MAIKLSARLYLGLSAVLPLVAGGCDKQQQGAHALTADQKASSELNRPPTPRPGAVPELPVASVAADPAYERLPEIDRQFVATAAGHNAAAIRYGQLAMQRAPGDRARDLGHQLADHYSILRNKLNDVTKREGLETPHAQLTPDEDATIARLASLSGPAFNDAFARAATDVQEQTMSNFQNEAGDGQNPALRRFAADMIPNIIESARSVQRDMNLM